MKSVYGIIIFKSKQQQGYFYCKGAEDLFVARLIPEPPLNSFALQILLKIDCR